MKRTNDRDMAELHSAEGHAALYVYDKDRRGILFDQDRARLQGALVKAGLGVQFIHVRNDAKPGQCVDVSGSTLADLIAGCENDKILLKDVAGHNEVVEASDDMQVLIDNLPEKKSRKTVKIEKKEPVKLLDDDAPEEYDANA